MKLEVAKLAWLQTLNEQVKRFLPSLKDSARRLLLAHAALESGWGTANAYRHGYNFGNITAGSQWKGAKWVDHHGDLVYLPDGTSRIIDQEWRAYSSLNDALADYWSFLGPTQNGGRYVKARHFLEDGDAIRFCLELHDRGYYTLPSSEYSHRLGRVLQIVGENLE